MVIFSSALQPTKAPDAIFTIESGIIIDFSDVLFAKAVSAIPTTFLSLTVDGITISSNAWLYETTVRFPTASSSNSKGTHLAYIA